ncbi:MULTISPECIES: FAD-dependent monooxygenase [Streptomyces]|uniref:Monooxygenase n=1 Tax=Streptomyces venezuelae TaxID=54571 RepID=A0A5P2B3N3_STRVZ|nr:MULTISPECIES: FAD-dependent monooxygenase [Streptomyces]MYY85212.1 FAD-binding protein [Streptomyces sp. SID335]MYZ16154.1 FAD-binding protein [Streptomyces sp. SID337]NDZ90884.1 FAD-binding protein [Streptomyces sp. SID10115]NEB49017.1 FAD-binding protein [Streptomyces sp. SID339]QES25083.1 monooxygenase [Streptomyces venezuelae]
MNTDNTGNTEDTGNAHDTDVIVVGAGPAGLMLAGELRLGGARVIVLERLAEPTGQSRGLGFTARAMEVFDQRGLLPRFGQGPTLEVSPLGHFGGVQFDYTALEDAHFGARGIPQNQTEAVLEAWARELGADIRRGWRVTDLAEGFLDGDHVEVTAHTPDGPRGLRAAYLVGCDGGQSSIRKAAGFGFPGLPATRTMYLADVEGCHLKPRFLGERLPNGMVMAAPLEEGVDRIIVCPHGVPAQDRDDDITFAEVAAAWQHITGEDISAGSAQWVSSFSDATRQADTYRRGRVLLAGDAAHIHLPAGGQGLSTGVQDAVNLGWKLAATVRGTAPAGLLDTYHAERHPVGQRLLMNTRAQGIVFLGGEQSDPLRALFTELIAHEEVKRHLAGIVSHLDIHYDMTPPGTESLPAPHPLLGHRLPKRPLTGADGESDTARLLHSARGVLLDLADNPGLRAAAAPWANRVQVVTATAKPAEGTTDALTGLDALLIRPDGHVAWTSHGTPDGLTTALTHWFGPERAA